MKNTIEHRLWALCYFGLLVASAVMANNDKDNEVDSDQNPDLKFNDKHIQNAIRSFSDLIHKLDGKIAKIENKMDEWISKMESVQVEVSRMKDDYVNSTNVLKREIETLIELPEFIEKSLEKNENDSLWAKTPSNSNATFPLLQTLAQNTILKYFNYRGQSCNTIRQQLNSSSCGVYGIFPFHREEIELFGPFDPQSTKEAFCDMETDGGGWTVFQRRGIPGNLSESYRSELFNKTWEEYRIGFGDPNSDYWLGLEAVHKLTKYCNNEILITATALDNTEYQALYSQFSIADENDNFRLTVGNFRKQNSTLQNYFKIQNGTEFSTIDRDNDSLFNASCSVTRQANGFWFRNCFLVSLNGMYPNDDHPATKSERGDLGITWYNDRGRELKMKRTEMKIRPYCEKQNKIE